MANLSSGITNKAVRDAIQAILAGIIPPDGEYGDWRPVIMALINALTHGGPDQAQALYNILANNNKQLAVLLADEATLVADRAVEQGGNQIRQAEAMADFPPLPVEACIDPAQAIGACSWLEDHYIPWSKTESGKAYEGFHKACGLALLSIIAGPRIYIPLGAGEYPMLYIGLVAPSGQYAKTFTIKKALKVLQWAGLSYLLLPDETTPEKMISLMAGGAVPEDYFQLDEQKQELIQLRLAFAGQRGWHYDEFGQKLDAMGRENGPMADFSGMLRRMYDGHESYSRATQIRGLEEVDNPYLTILAGWTPSDMKRNPKTASALWYNGFWGRWAPIYPTTPPVRNYKRAWHKELFGVPEEITAPLVQWHKQLGIPTVTIKQGEDEKGKPAGRIKVEVKRSAPHICDTEAIEAAFERYQEALEILIPNVPEMLASNYERYAMMALHIAALLASLENNGVITLRHWAYAQQTTEEWRTSLHLLYEQINQTEPSRASQEEEKVLYYVRKFGKAKPADIARATKRSTAECRLALQALESSGIVIRSEEGRCKEVYSVAVQEERATG